jgi:hypothetical protein
MLFKELAGSFQGFVIFQIPDTTCINPSSGGRKICQGLAQPPLGPDFAELFQRG